MLNFNVKFGAAPTKMPLRYWAGIVILIATQVLSRLYGSENEGAIGLMLFLGATVFSIAWFWKLQLLSDFGVWCILPVFLLLSALEDGASNSFTLFGEFSGFIGLTPLAIFNLLFYRSYVGFQGSK